MRSINALDLFVQWVYTGEYTELSGSVVSLGLANDVPDLKMDINRQKLKAMDCAVKAAILAWFLGDELQVAAFQNHAMTRLFAALARSSEKPQLTPTLYDCASRSSQSDEYSHLEIAVQHLVIWNWVDASTVDQEDLEGWDSRITSCGNFRKTFFKGSLLSLGQRREKVLVAKDHFCGGLP